MANGPNRLADEFAKLMTDAAGMAQSMRKEVETIFKTQAERMVAEMDLVKRDDFEAAKEMAANARAENERLIEKLASLETRIAVLEQSMGGSSAKGEKKS